MSELVLETPEGVRLRHELAGPGTRVLSGAIDALLFVLVLASAILALALLGFEPGVVILSSGAIVFLVAYWFVSSLFLDGATVGKLLVGTRVRDVQGFAASPTQLFLRALFVPFEAVLVLPIPLLFALLALLPRHQRLGDLVAGTVVLRTREPRVPAEPAPGVRWSTLAQRHFALEPAAVRASFTAGDLAYLRELLARHGLASVAKDELHRRSALAFARRLERLDPRAVERDPKLFLRELFLCLRELEDPASLEPTAEGAGARGSARSGARRRR
jgi:uncharacterized RDD family membrane protein YckC